MDDRAYYKLLGVTNIGKPSVRFPPKAAISVVSAFDPLRTFAAAIGKENLCSQTSIDCWAKIPAIAPCHDAVLTEGMRGLARSPAA